MSTPGDGYGARYASQVDSAIRRRIKREVYGEEYPEELDPRSFVTRTELRRIAGELRVGPGGRFVDLGGGHGGPSVWVAARTGAALVGLDLSRAAIARAAAYAETFGVARRAGR